METGQSLDIPGLLKPRAVESFDGGIALVLEDFNGQSLELFLQNDGLAPASAVELARRLADTIGQLHSQEVVHKDVRPSNVLYDAETGRVRLTNLFNASRLTRESPTAASPHTFGGDLAYVSPEQTGRMNRSVDYRTDFYSLGVLLYRLLTGKVPFEDDNPLGLVHSHIALRPAPPHEVAPSVPRSLSDVVMKLLEKTAEDRYQSAFGLKADLDSCLTHLESGAPDSFEVGTKDVSSRLQIPEKLYGRASELDTLMGAYERAAAGPAEMVLIAGYSGIGKTSLVKEVHKPIVRSHGYFCSGKFDQFKRNIPFASIVEAFRDLVRQILTEDADRIAQWKAGLTEVLGPNGRVVTDVIPEVELIIGPQAPITQLGATESANRFELVFKNLVGAFATPEHPMVLFLDDLQWADAASLKLIELLVGNPEQTNLLVIGAYRDNEVNAGHPLMVSLESLKSKEARVETITLEALGADHVWELVQDSLRRTDDEAKDLARILHEKTHGNPFFVIQLFESWGHDRLVTFDLNEGRWSWNTERVEAASITDNVVELMTKKLGELPEDTQELLKLASCMGAKFELGLLAAARDSSIEDVAGDLRAALTEGLVVPLTADYEAVLRAKEEQTIVCKFLHDRVQQAAYGAIADDERPAMHLKIGRLLRKRTSDESSEDEVFEIVNALNAASQLITDPDEILDVARLNHQAGRRAKGSTAYASSIRYLERGIELLGEQAFKDHAALANDLYSDAAETAFLGGQLDRARALAAQVLEHDPDLENQLRMHELRIQFEISENKMPEAIALGLDVLEKLDVHLKDVPDELPAQFERFRAALAAKDIEVKDLARLPEMTEARDLAAMRILMNLSAPAFITDPPLWQKIIFRMVELCIDRGNSPTAGFCYVYVGNLLTGAMNDLDEGYAIGKLALDLLEKYEARQLQVKANVPYNLCIRHYREYVGNTIQSFYEAIQMGLETGDIEFACFNACNYCTMPFLTGENLESVLRKQQSYGDFCAKFKQEWHVGYISIWHQATLNLLGASEHRTKLVGEACNEDELLPAYIEAKNATSIFTAYLWKSMLHFLFNEYEQSAEIAASAADFAAGALGFSTVPVWNFYRSLALLAQIETGKASDHADKIEQVESNQEMLVTWADSCPDNYRHKHTLVAAELSRARGEIVEAMRGYDEAIRGARDNGFVQEEAVASERAARFYFGLGHEESAQLNLTSAARCYERWGAKTKVDQLLEEFPSVSRAAGDSFSGRSLDVDAIVGVSQALSGDLVLDKLLEKTMSTIMANAGAQRGLLLIQNGLGWGVEAEANIESGEVSLPQGAPLTGADGKPKLSVGIVNYVVRSRESVVLDDATREGQFTRDPYILEAQPKSVLCAPLLDRGNLRGIIYLENNLSTSVFIPEKVELLRIISSQAAMSLQNARLYEELEHQNRNLEQIVEERTQELRAKNDELQLTLQTLKATQDQIVAREKLAQLGSLAAGIAHEIQNPLNFVNNFARISVELSQELKEELTEQASPGIDKDKRGELVALADDIGEGADSILKNGSRAQKIVQDVLLLSQSKKSERTPVDLNRMLEQRLHIAGIAPEDEEDSLNIDVKTEFDNDVGEITVFPGDLARAVLNVFRNSFYAIREKATGVGESYAPSLTVKTKNRPDSVWISIRDNGTGIAPDALDKIFNPFFTTKPTDQGTGLGLSISHDIIVQAHQGDIAVDSKPGEYTEVAITLPKNGA